MRVVRRAGAGADCLHVDVLVALADGALAPVETEAAKSHVSVCDGCGEVFKALASGAALLPQASADAFAVTCVTAVRAHEPEPGKSGLGDVLEPGRRIDTFEIVKLLGRGGMGAVYLARDTVLDRRVALKVITADQLREPSATKRFMREARITARVNHPSIVTIHTVGEHEGLPYLALEYIAGVSLRSWMAGQRSESEIIGVTATIAEALAEAHRHGVLHRDLKPDNVLVDRSGRARVLDFGIAETVHLDEPPQSFRLPDQQEDVGPLVTGLVGTPRYMAPEQWREAACTGATDVWALGVMLFQMLTGKHPFWRTSDRSQLVLAALTANESVDDDLLAGVNEPLRTIALQCLREDPAERPDAANLAGELRSLLTVTTTMAVPTTAEVAPPLPAPPRAALWLAGLGATVLGGVLAAVLFGRGLLAPSAPSAPSMTVATSVPTVAAPSEAETATAAATDEAATATASSSTSAAAPTSTPTAPTPATRPLPPTSLPTATAPPPAPASKPPPSGELLKQW